ncbi:MAG: AAA family ATPase [Candidatus Micrarchaeota archaeon]
MISSISLTNWRSHESSRLEFSKGTNIIIGIMGSGKSSVVDAVCFALFGNFPALQHRKLKLSEVIRSRPTQQDEAKVELELALGESKYTLSRTIRFDGASSAEVRKDGKLLEAQPKRVNELIEKLLSIDYDLFTRAIYSEQNNIDYFLELARGDRKRQMDELIGIDRFETVRSEIVKAVNRLKQSISEKESFIKGADRMKIEAELANSKGEKESIEKELSLLAYSLQSLSSERLSLEKSLSALESQRSEHRKLSERKFGLSHAVESTCKKLSCKPEDLDEKTLKFQSESLKAKMSLQNKELEDLEASGAKLAAELGSRRAKLNDIEEKARRRAKLESELIQLLEGKTLRDIEKEISSITSDFNSGVESLGKMRAHVNDAFEANTKLEGGEGKCPTCESPLSEGRKNELLQKRNAELEKIGGEMKALEKSLAHKQAVLKKSQEKLSKASSLEAKLSELEAKEGKGELEAEIAKREKERDELEKKLKGQRASALLDEGSLRVLDEKLRLSATARELSELEKRLAMSKFNEHDYELARDKVGAVRVSEGGARAKKEGLEREARKTGEVMKLVTEKLAQLDIHSKSILGMNSSIEQLSIFGNCVTETQRELREELLTAINATMSQVWSSVYPYADYSELRLSADDKGYELEARIGEAWVPVDGVASGGERALSCLALRIAFAMVLAPNLNWLILDEPTHNLDEEAVRSLSSAFHEKIPEIVEQTFIITHDENLKDAASGSLYQISRKKDESEPSRIERL